MSPTSLRRPYLILILHAYVPTLVSSDACVRRSLPGWRLDFNLLHLGRFHSTMPASSFFPLGFDAPGTQILLIHFLISFHLSFLFSFSFSLFVLPPDLCFEEECWSVERCSMIMIGPYVTHTTINTIQGHNTLLSHSIIWLRWVLWPPLFHH